MQGHGQPETDELIRFALSMWPRLQGRQLRRATGDPRRLARIIVRRTALPLETVLGMLESGRRRPT